MALPLMVVGLLLFSIYEKKTSNYFDEKNALLTIGDEKRFKILITVDLRTEPTTLTINGETYPIHEHKIYANTHDKSIDIMSKDLGKFTFHAGWLEEKQRITFSNYLRYQS